MNKIQRRIARLGLVAVCSLLLGLGSLFAKSVSWPDSPEAFTQKVQDLLIEKELAAVWTALPDTYQEEATTLLQLAGEKLDPAVYDRGFELLARFADLLESKQEFIITSMVETQEDREQAEEGWPTLVKVMRDLSKSEIASTKGLSSLDMSKFLAGTGTKLLTDIEALAAIDGEDIFADFRETRVVLVENAGDRATVRYEKPGEEEHEEEVLVLVDGRWLPEEMATSFSADMAEATAALNAITDEEMAQVRMQASMMYGMVDGVLAQLEAAESQEAFDATMQGVQEQFGMMLMPFMMMMQEGDGMMME